MVYFQLFCFTLLFAVNLAKNTEYLLQPERSNITYLNPEFCESDFSITIRRLNRTTFSMSAITNYLKDIEDAEMNIEFKQFLNNEYKNSGITLTAPMCDLMGDEDLNVYKKFTTDGVHGNLPECDGTIPKGRYFVKDAIVGSKIQKTIFLPGKWKCEFKATNIDNVVAFAGEIYFKIDEIMVNN